MIEPEDVERAESIAAAVTRAIHHALGFAPEKVIAVKPRSIPITANGKIRHDVLRAQLADGTLAVVFRAPSDQ